MKSITSPSSRKQQRQRQRTLDLRVHFPARRTRAARQRPTRPTRAVTIAEFTGHPASSRSRRTCLTNLFAIVILYAGGQNGGRVELVKGAAAAQRRVAEIDLEAARYELSDYTSVEIRPAELLIAGTEENVGAMAAACNAKGGA